MSRFCDLLQGCTICYCRQFTSMQNELRGRGAVVFLTVIMISSALSGCLEADEDVSENLPPMLEDHDSVPETITKGEIDRIEVELLDESLQTVIVEVSVNDNPVGTEFALRYDDNGVERKFVVVTISDLDAGFHKIRISAEDENGQRTSWIALISIVEESIENEGEVENNKDQDSDSQGDGSTGDQNGSTGDQNGSTGDQNGSTGDQNGSTGDDTVPTLEEWWHDVLLCDEGGSSGVDDYNTSGFDNHLCQLSFITNETHIEITSNGIPNHDLESGPGCCTSTQEHVWTIPLEPTNQTDCNPSVSTDGCTMAPERGAVAFAANGVPIFGPEDGPGGDAVAGQEGAYEEDRQHVWLGICHAHSGPGGEYHYHADSNCIHWHPDEENGESWSDYSIDSSRNVTSHSPIVGFALDGYPIYGFVGWDSDGEVTEMTSSYRLKDGETGYNGIDDYKYVSGLGDLDSCNGQFGVTPDYPEGVYHYHTTWENGEGGIGFPYFINCYRGVVESGETDDGGNPDCSGHGETWGPGIGPPPEGCGGGGQMDSSGSIVVPSIGDIGLGGGGLSAALGLVILFVAASAVRAVASSSASRDLAGRADGCHPAPV